jgi:hypothetical protein
MSKGKANAFKELERALLAKIQEEFPEDATTYLGAVGERCACLAASLHDG